MIDLVAELAWLVLLVTFGLALLVWGYWRVYGRHPTFDEYRAMHPDLFKNGRCRCRHCGGGRMYLQGPDAGSRLHVCVTCGKVLYRS